MRGGFVDREPGTVGCQLEEHAARLLEVHRLEPEAIDHRRGMMARRFDTRSHLVLMLLIVYAPREVVDAADAPRAAPALRCFAHVEHARRSGKAIANQTVLLAESLELSHRERVDRDLTRYIARDVS